MKLALLCLPALSPELVYAQLPTARLSTIFPPGGKVGTTFEVTVSGIDLDDATQLRFSIPEISAQPKLAEITGLPEPNQFIVTVVSNVPLGVCDVRVVGQFGISDPRSFVIGQWPETIEKSGNDSIESAAEIPLGTTINGHADQNAIDHFKFTARKGQRVLIECAAQRIDSKMDASLILCDGSGRELDRNRLGGLLDFTVPNDGQYFLQVHDFLYRGGGEYFYRLSLGSGPHLDFIFPPSGLAGTTNTYILYGRNLPGSTPAKILSSDGKPLEHLSVEIELPNDAKSKQRPSDRTLLRPAEAVVGGIEYRLTTPQGISNPLLLSFATAPVVAEQEPNDTPQLAHKVSLPCEYVGQMYPAGDQDWIIFEAKKGDVYWVEIFSNRLGLPTDPFVLVQRVARNDKGEEQVSDVQELNDSEANIGGVEFKTTSLDPAWRFEASQEGTYRIQVRDLFNRTVSNPQHVYRLSLRKEAPDFRLVALPQAPAPAKKDAKEAMQWTALLRRGETIPIKVLAFRRDGFGGEISLGVEELPPGLVAGNTKIEAGKSSGIILLTAHATATNWSGPIRVVGKAKIGDSERVREAQGGTISWNVPDYNTEPVRSRLARNFSLAVCGEEEAPLSVVPAGHKASEAPVDGKLKIPLTVIRRAEFNEALKLKAAGITALDSLKELEVDGKATNATLEIDLAQNKIPPGTHVFYLQAQTKGKFAANSERAKLAEAAAKEAEQKAAELAAEAKKAAEAIATADKLAQEADALAKAAMERAAAAKTAAEQNPADEKVLVAKEGAQQELETSGAKARLALETKTTAEKTANELSARAKAAEARKAALAERAKAAAERAKSREMTIWIYSAPIEIKVTEKQIASGEKK